MLAGKRLRCDYSVVKYVADHIRDEPRNLGVLIRSVDGKHHRSKFINSFNNIKDLDRSSFLQDVVTNLKDVDLPVMPLDKLEKKYCYQIRLSPPRPILVDDLDKDAEMMFDKFISIKETPRKNMVSRFPDLGKYTWKYLQKTKKNPKRGVAVKGKNSAFAFTFSYGEKTQSFLHLLPFGIRGGLKRTKLFDWGVSDILKNNEHEKSAFRTLVIKPDKRLPSYDALNDDYVEAIDILTSGDYDLKCLDCSRPWKKDLELFVRAP